MDTQSFGPVIVGFILGGVISALVSILVVRSKTDRTLTALEADKARLSGQLDGIEAAHQKALADKDVHCRNLIEAHEEGMRRRLLEKDLSVQAVLQEKDKAIFQQKQLLSETEHVLSEKFNDLSVKSLDLAGEDFLKLANERLKPVSETLEKLEKQHQEMEQRRVSAFDAIEAGLKTLSTEADLLANALRKPATRGAWGEMNLQVILENAGLVEGEHFVVQDATSDSDEGVRRTDVVIKLPNGRCLIIDSKTPLEAFWEGMNSVDDAARRERFAVHARLVREHVKALASKSYWTRYSSAPDFTIMFLPTEGAYQSAVEADPGLMSDAQKMRVYVTSPMNLMSMVHAIAFVLREERLAQNAQLVQETAAELYSRLARFLEHVEKLGRNLRLTVDNFNSAVGSLDTRVLPTARRMNAMGISGAGDVPDVSPVEALPRTLISQDHLLLDESGEGPLG